MTAFGCKAQRQGRIALAGLLLTTLLSLLSLPPSHAASPITIENARPGQSDWVLTNPADHEIEGYASATSIQRGEPLRLYIHSIDPRVTVDIYRMGWYGGAGARLVRGGITLPGIRQPMPTPDPVTGLIECNWQ
ncbi:MAG TPA: hypothetical protein PKI21_12315, partial [Nitrospira sp.]|nr:hypothetical protein [Nitrospira sp.]